MINLCQLWPMLNWFFCKNATFCRKALRGQIGSSKFKIALFGNLWTNFLKSFKIHIDFILLFLNLSQYSIWYFKILYRFKMSPLCFSIGKWNKSWEIKLLLPFILEQCAYSFMLKHSKITVWGEEGGCHWQLSSFPAKYNSFLRRGNCLAILRLWSFLEVFTSPNT